MLSIDQQTRPLNIAVVGKNKEDLNPLWAAIQNLEGVKSVTLAEKVKELKGNCDILIQSFNLEEQANIVKHLSRMHKQVNRIQKIAKKAKIIQVVYLGKQEDVYSENFKTLRNATENLKMGISTIPFRVEEFEKDYQNKVRGAAIKIETALSESNFCHPQTVRTREQLLDIAFSFMKAKSLLTAIRFSLFTKLEKSSKTLAKICHEMEWNPVPAKDLLDILVAIGALEKDGNAYRNNEATFRYLVKGQEGYLGEYTVQIDRDLYQSWGNLAKVLSKENTDKPTKFDEDHTKTTWVTAMESLSNCWAKVVAKLDLWKHYQHVLDVGSCRGLVSAIIGREHKHLDFTLFDLPKSYNDTKMEPAIESLMKENPHMEGRVKTVFGNILEIEKLPETEVLVLGHFLHNFGEKDKEIIIKKCTDAIKHGGALIVTEYFIDDERKQHLPGLLMSLNMGVVHGEKSAAADYSKADLKEWLKETGQFESFNVVDLTDEHSALIAFKKIEDY